MLSLHTICCANSPVAITTSCHTHNYQFITQTRYLEYLGQRSNGGKSGKNTNAGSSSISRLQRTNSNTSFSSEPGAAAASNSSWDGFQGPPGDGSSSSSNWALERSESLEAALAAVSGSSSLRRRSRQQQQQSSACSSPRWSTLQDRSEPGLWGGFEGGGTRPVGLSTSSLFDFLLPGGWPAGGVAGQCLLCWRGMLHSSSSLPIKSLTLLPTHLCAPLLCRSSASCCLAAPHRSRSWFAPQLRSPAFPYPFPCLSAF